MSTEKTIRESICNFVLEICPTQYLYNSPCMIKVLFFASLKDIVGTAIIEMELRENTLVKTIFETLKNQFPKLATYEPVILVAINQEYSSFESRVSSGDEVAFFPPVSGGQS